MTRGKSKHPPTAGELVDIIRALEKKLGHDWWDMLDEDVRLAVRAELKKRGRSDDDVVRVMAAALAYYTPRPLKDPSAFIHFLLGINGIEAHAALFESLGPSGLLYALVQLAEISRRGGHFFRLSGKVLEWLIAFMVSAGLPLKVLRWLPPYKSEAVSADEIARNRYTTHHAPVIIDGPTDLTEQKVLKVYHLIRGNGK